MMNKSPIKSILVISLSNIGDIVLTFPVIDILCEDFPEAALSVIVGPKGEGLLQGNPHIHRVHVFHKRQGFWPTVRWIRSLRRTPTDLVVDLRNTAIPFFLKARHRTSFFLRRLEKQHMTLQHLDRLKSVYPFTDRASRRVCLSIPDKDKNYVAGLVNDRVGRDAPFIVTAPGAADRGKRWTTEGFAALSDRIAQSGGPKVVFVGDNNDRETVQNVLKRMRHPGVDLSGRLTLLQLAHLLKLSRGLIANDTAPMHLASYLDVPVVALFGPTDPVRYGPWGPQGRVVERKKECPACQHREKGLEHVCMRLIPVEDVMNAMMAGRPAAEVRSPAGQ